ncbi:hypothetical protein C0993_007664 [Termitomyces sp. T159_Od127]|nr:hypothetical protein C0993_007664 [Termitomyces sp. T159_Od127]
MATKPCNCTTCRGTLVSPENTYSYTNWLQSSGVDNQRHASSSPRDSEDEAEDIERLEVGSESRKRPHLLSLDKHKDGSEEGPSDIGQLQQEQDEMTPITGIEHARSGHESDSHGKELSGPADFDDPIFDEPLFDNFEEDEDETAAAATCAHAQIILDTYNGTQDVPFTGTEEEEESLPEAHIESLRITQEYICLIQNASLDEDKLDSETLDCLRNPIEGPLDTIDPDERLSLELFTATNSSEATYNQCHSAILQRYSDSGILTFYKVKQLVANISGIVPVMDDMCINSCHAFTGPFSDLDACTICKEPRYDPVQLAKHGKKVP